MMAVASSVVIAANVYNTDGDGGGAPTSALAEYLDRRSPHVAVRNEEVDATGAPVGFFCYGSAAGVVFDGAEPQLYNVDGSLNVGLGLRPDLTGRGLGLAFTQ